MTTNLHRSIIASAVLSVVLVALLVTVGSVMARPMIRDAALTAMLGGVDVEECEADPESFGRGRAGLSLFAYDGSGRSAHPGAPIIEPELLQEAQRSGRSATRDADGQVVSVVPLGSGGACAFVRVSYGRLATVARTQLLGVLLFATASGMLLSGVGTYRLVVRPLRRRIDALAKAARAVGTASFRPPSAGSGSLGTIAEVLEQTHDRVELHRDALERRNLALEDHLAGIAHDLRTPLASLQLSLEGLATQSGADAEASRALGEVVYLSALVENLHQAARLRHDPDITTGSVELGTLVRRLEERFSIVGRHAGVEVAASVPEHAVWVACAPAFAERALANLVQNAIEHNDAPGHVAVTMEVSADGRTFTVSILDDGPGLPEHAHASLLEATFSTEAARTRGPGLGMLITAEVARRAGWSVRHESQPSGHAVRVTGPIGAPEDGERPTTTGSSEARMPTARSNPSTPARRAGR